MHRRRGLGSRVPAGVAVIGTAIWATRRVPGYAEARTHEIGIRMARGADIERMVLRNTLRIMDAGIVIGLTGAWPWAPLRESNYRRHGPRSD